MLCRCQRGSLRVLELQDLLSHKRRIIPNLAFCCLQAQVRTKGFLEMPLILSPGLPSHYGLK